MDFLKEKRNLLEKLEQNSKLLTTYLEAAPIAAFFVPLFAI
ncbi:MAG: hypothetical protein ACI9N1_003053 [Flavobacteriales bacterium]|jgi:hypothetical protein